MEKMVRQLEDLVNSETSVVKKIGQLEAENLNFGNSLLEKQLPEVLSKSEETLEIATSLFNERLILWEEWCHRQNGFQLWHWLIERDFQSRVVERLYTQIIQVLVLT